MKNVFPRFVLPVIGIGVVGLSFWVGMQYENTLATESFIGTPLLQYSNDNLHFFLQYPKELNQITESATGVTFSIKNSEDITGFGVNVADASSFATTADWLNAQPKGSTTRAGYEPIARITSDEILVARYEVVDQDGTRPIYGIIVEAVEVKNHKLYTIEYHNQFGANDLVQVPQDMYDVMASFSVDTLTDAR